MKTKSLIYLGLIFIISSCQESLNSDEIRIGEQVWMSENLNVTTFRNGDPIPEVKTDEEWVKAGKEGKPAWCYYENRVVQNDSENGKKYGKLYNGYAVCDPRGLAPSGWHIPSDDEWTILTNFLGGEEYAGEKMKTISGGWTHFKYQEAKIKKGTNESGFSGLPGGARNAYNGECYLFGLHGRFWSSTESSKGGLIDRNISTTFNNLFRGSSDKTQGQSVRCIKD